MVYSLWIVFFLIILGLIVKVKRARDEYLRAKAEEEKRAELNAKLSKVTEEMLTHRGAQGQSEAKQGQTVDLSKMLGTHGQKERLNN